MFLSQGGDDIFPELYTNHLSLWGCPCPPPHPPLEIHHRRGGGVVLRVDTAHRCPWRAFFFRYAGREVVPFRHRKKIKNKNGGCTPVLPPSPLVRFNCQMTKASSKFLYAPRPPSPLANNCGRWQSLKYLLQSDRHRPPRCVCRFVDGHFCRPRLFACSMHQSADTAPCGTHSAFPLARSSEQCHVAAVQLQLYTHGV